MTCTRPPSSTLDSLEGLGTEPLSAAARARRDALRSDIDAAVRARGTQRVAVRTVATALLVICATTIGVVAHRGSPPASDPIGPPPTLGPSNHIARGNHPLGTPASKDSTSHLSQPPMRPAAVLVGYVADDPTVLERFGTTQTAAGVIELDDRALLDELRAIGLPAGLVQTQDHTRLAFHHTRPADPVP